MGQETNKFVSINTLVILRTFVCQRRPSGNERQPLKICLNF